MLVRKLLEQDKFKPITFGEFSVLKTTFFSELKEVECALDFNPNFCTRLIEPGKEKKAVASVIVWFADFESDPDVNKTEPIPFIVVIDNALTSNQHMIFKGRDCGRQLLEYVPKNSLIYFHNLGYDIRFLARYGICGGINKGTWTINATIRFMGKKIKLADSFELITDKLCYFTKMFGFEKTIRKELFPYKYYTMERLDITCVRIEEGFDN
jgi:hypothetical protein